MAAAILRRDRGVSERWRFASIELREPSKRTVGEFSAGDPIRREAVVICWNRDDGQVYKAVVALGDDRVLAWEHQPDGQPNMTVDEFHECDARCAATSASSTRWPAAASPTSTAC